MGTSLWIPHNYNLRGEKRQVIGQQKWPWFAQGQVIHQELRCQRSETARSELSFGWRRWDASGKSHWLLNRMRPLLNHNQTHFSTKEFPLWSPSLDKLLYFDSLSSFNVEIFKLILHKQMSEGPEHCISDYIIPVTRIHRKWVPEYIDCLNFATGWWEQLNNQGASTKKRKKKCTSRRL